MDITNQIFTDRHYQMDSKFEDLVYGTDLKNGMIVLVEDALTKGDPQYIDSDYDKHRLMVSNRWCEVTQFSIVHRGGNSPLIKFIGLYADGSKHPRTYDAMYCWVVKKPVLTDDI